ncbi:hypothetical protein HK100_010963, partial [Physocladia obscura]
MKIPKLTSQAWQTAYDTVLHKCLKENGTMTGTDVKAFCPELQDFKSSTLGSKNQDNAEED